ncbi:VC0807 family protein [Ilumatobacter sp.]|uniref:VC0807 family protein n=1 Tax=Ilumatobacter sp. TaxID=1967498 RepID=UPI003AF4D516
MSTVGEVGPSDASWRVDPSWTLVVWAVVRRLFPYLVEATLIPTAMYYAGLVTVGQMWGILAAAACTYVSVSRRILRRRPVPGLLVVASVGISVRVAMYLVNESAFVYFVQPIIKTIATALLFAISVLIGKPLVARFAADFCAFGDDVGGRPAIVSLFRRLTFLWAGAQVTIAAANLTLLLTVPVAVFVGTAAATAWTVMCAGVVITVADAVRTTRNDGLRTALAHGGRLHAYVTPAP